MTRVYCENIDLIIVLVNTIITLFYSTIQTHLKSSDDEILELKTIIRIIIMKI